MASKAFRFRFITLGLAASLALGQSGCSAPASLQAAGQAETASAAPQPAADRLSDELRVRLRLPASAARGSRFHTLDALATEASYVRLVIKAADLSREYTNPGGITLNGVDHLEAISPAELANGKVLSVPGIPRGSNRLVIAQVYDAQGQELTSLRAMGLFHSKDQAPSGSLRFADENTNTFVIEQTVSRRYLPLLSMLEAAIDADDQDFLDAIENHLDTLAEEFDQLVYGNVTPGPSTPFVVDPQSLDVTEIYQLLKTEVANQDFEPQTDLDGFFSSNQASFTESPVNVTVWLATPTGFDFTQDMKVIVDDPNSSEASVSSTNADSPLSVTVNGVLRGERRLTVTSATGLVLGHTTLTVDPDTAPGYVFAGGAGSTSGNPLVLVGGETGIVISSIVSPSNLLAEVQGTGLTLNGVGYAENPNHAANLVKFTNHSNGEGAVTVPPTSATTTSVNLNVPDLIGGTYLITVERLGVISNSRNFSIVPVAAQLEQPNTTVITNEANGATIVVRGTGFDPDPADNTVHFGTSDVTPTAVAPDRHSLTVQVPATTFGSQNVAVTVGGQTSATTPFKIKPVISGLKSLAETAITSSRIGDELYIDGTGFSTIDGGNTVVFGGVTVNPANVVEISENRLKVTVPPNVSGTANVSVSVEGVVSAASAFEVIPTIAAVGGVSPLNGVIGSNVTITGSGFAPTAAGNTVKFGLSTVPTGDITVNSNTSLTVKVPAGVFANPPIDVKVGNLTSNSNADFHVTPVISGFETTGGTPITSGRIGSTVVIRGTGFSPTPAENSVDFDSSLPSTVLSSSNTSLTLLVPGRSLDAGSRDVNVTVGTRTSSDRSFTARVTTPCVEPDFNPSLLNAQEPLRFVDCFDATPSGSSGSDFNSDDYFGLSRVDNRFGQSNKAYHLNGNQSYRRLNWNINPSSLDDVTISVWAQLGPITDPSQMDPDWNPLGDVFPLISSDNGPFDRTIALDYRGTSAFSWVAFAGADPSPFDSLSPVVGNAGPQIGAWAHVVAVYDNSANLVKLYINGELNSFGATDMSDGFPFVLVGRNPGGFGDRYFFGDVDDVMVYKEALSDAQVLALYNATKP